MGKYDDSRFFITRQCGNIFAQQRRSVEQSSTVGYAGNRRSAVGAESYTLITPRRDSNHRSPGGAEATGQTRPVGEQPSTGFIQLALREIDKNKNFAVDAHQISLPILCPSQMAISTLRGATQSPIRYSSGTFPFKLMYRSSSTCCPMTRTRES